MVLLESDYAHVGPGWKPILEALDRTINNILSNNKTRCQVKILQIKEKFGGLRFYYEPIGLDEEQKARLWGAVMMAECMSYRTCEACGSTAEVSTECKRNVEKSLRAGRRLTLCNACHQRREADGYIEFGGFKCH